MAGSSKNPTQTEIDNVVPWKSQITPSFSGVPQVFRLDRPEIQCPIKMSRAAKCDFVVYDDKEKPLADATVGLWPNHYWLKGGSTLFGFGFDSAKLLRGQLPRDALMNSNAFRGKTDENGAVTIANLPSGPNIGYAVMHDDFDMPITNQRRSARVPLEPGKTKQVTVYMQPKGKDALGE